LPRNDHRTPTTSNIPPNPPSFEPLRGVRVVDLTSSLAGPACTELLAALGADVVKVERPGTGDESRAWGPSMFLAANAGKRSLALDLKDPRGREALLRLTARADVLVESLRPGAAERLGLDADVVREHAPALVHCRIGAYGPGPLESLPGYDPLMQAFAGIISVTGELEGETVRVGVSLVDYATAWWAAIGILAALHAGGSRLVDVSLLETALALVGYHVSDALAGAEPGKHGSAFPHIAPYQVFRTADGEVMLAAGNDRLFAELRTRLGLEDDPAFATNAGRVARREELAARIQERLELEPTATWLERLEGIPVAPVQSVREAATHPQTAALGIVAELTGRPRVGVPLSVDGSRVPLAGDPPRLGQHSAEVLGEAGYSEAEVEELAAAGVVVLGNGPAR
jgi:crotonobetainyl-CoA:carnitine CoA-transferase CaiB-like acyl-CoA transferase